MKIIIIIFTNETNKGVNKNRLRPLREDSDQWHLMKMRAYGAPKTFRRDRGKWGEFIEIVSNQLTLIACLDTTLPEPR